MLLPHVDYCDILTPHRTALKDSGEDRDSQVKSKTLYFWLSYFSRRTHGLGGWICIGQQTVGNNLFHRVRDLK